MPGHTLITASNMTQPDEFYERLIDMHRELTPQQSEAANVALILLLANHVGDLAVLQQAMDIARADAQQV
ncbi:DUF2783 domain-containing protein [Noviherbaspirillum sp. Root189]|uniref:DUF2783 domain-containing protein n=1 Tax=Noviherbaspirillum sp. Root189 TaxID=1736487 RepID=UPI00070915CD|nr:DUF2783 domain-containing protein [Noviherbaspirillum sp. Root189]KRB84855.1 hypothetical protein ASE07_22530 [Noviherbaspirillum sp. Root189]